MFELNLIKDKAKSRQRRRIIFLSVVSILFLSGLLAIFVGSLFWRETIAVKNAQVEVARIQGSLTDLKTTLDTREPAARKRRNALIEAFQEDVLIRQDRPYFNPILEDIAQHHPSSANFWYNSVQITADTQPGGGLRGQVGEDPYAASKSLMGTRGLEANGYVQIEASDIVTESELVQVAGRMDGFLKLVGKPTFNVDVAAEITPGGNPEESRYVPFTMRAAQTLFRSEAP